MGPRQKPKSTSRAPTPKSPKTTVKREGIVERRSGTDRRAADDRRVFPRPEGRRTGGGRRKGDRE